MAVTNRALFGQRWANDEFLKQYGDPEYIKDLLLARRDFLRLRRQEEFAIRHIYEKAAQEVAKQITKLSPGTGELTKRHLTALERALTEAAEQINREVQKLVKDSIRKSVDLSTRPMDNLFMRAVKKANVGLDTAVIQWGFAQVNEAAVEALWARTHKGLRVSDRIWKVSQNAKASLRSFVQTGVATGRGTIDIAKDLQRYVKTDIRTLATDYPNMMKRVGMKSRIPKDLSYEALRLVRTEKAKAYNEGVYARGRVNPSYQGVKWMLSDAHPVEDICDTLAEQDLYGMGAGVYPEGQEPVVPHPNCLCFTVPVLLPMEDMVDKLVEWLNNPSSQEEIEEWYRTFYLPTRRRAS